MEKSYLWLLDPGHGGIVKGIYQTSGKRSPKLPDGSQLFEGEFNRDIAKRIVNLCKKEGIETYNLVTTPIDVSLRQRVDLANQIFSRQLNIGGEKCIYLSIHANAYCPNKKIDFNTAAGWEVFTSPGETLSDKIADHFFAEMEKAFPNQKFRKDNSDGDVDKEANFYVLKNTAMPAVLTENFFMTNKENLALLMSDAERERIAIAHVDAMFEVQRHSIY